MAFNISKNVQLFIRSKNGILNVAIFKYSLHKFRETIHTPKIPIYLNHKNPTIFDSLQLVYMMTQKVDPYTKLFNVLSGVRLMSCLCHS